jgi:hypothetical protein
LRATGKDFSLISSSILLTIFSQSLSVSMFLSPRILPV